MVRNISNMKIYKAQSEEACATTMESTTMQRSSLCNDNAMS